MVKFQYLNLKIFATLILLFLIFPSAISQTQSPNILLLYSAEDEKDYFLDSITPLGIPIIAENLNTTSYRNFSEIDILIILSRNEIDLDDYTLQSLELFLADPDKISIIISPHLSDLADINLGLLGIQEVLDIYGLYDVIEWQISLVQNVSSVYVDSNYTYIGPVQATNVTDQDDIIAISTANNFSLPNDYPFLIQKGNNTTFPLALVPFFDLSLSLNSFHNPGSSNFFEVIIISVNSILDEYFTTFNSGDDGDLNDSSQNVEDPEELQDWGILPNFEDIGFGTLAFFLVAIIMALAAFSKTILEKIKQLFRKALAVGFVIFGGLSTKYKRLTTHDVLANEYRKNILDLIESFENIGCHLREIKDTISLGSSTLLWHLEVLEEFGFIEKFKVNRYTVYVSTYQADNFNYKLKEIDLEIRSTESTEIVSYLSNVARNSKTTTNDIADHTGVNKKTIQRTLTKLRDFGIIENGKNSDISITGYGYEVLDKIATIRDNNTDMSYSQDSPTIINQ